MANDPIVAEGFRSTNLKELENVVLLIVHVPNSIEGIDEDD